MGFRNARHPEVAAAYAAILNGTRFVAFHNTQRSDEAPFIDLSFEDVSHLARALQSTLSPEAIRQDCSPPKVDLDMPLANGLRSRANISKASILYEKFSWSSNIVLPPQAAAQLNETCRRQSGLRVNAYGGSIGRDEQSRIIVALDWAFPNDDLRRFAEQKQFADMKYICLSSVLSEDPLKPSVFHVAGNIDVNIGDSLFDIARWTAKIADVDAAMTYCGQATGFLKSGVFQGFVEARYEMSFPALPNVLVAMYGTGTVEISIMR
jgi:hypothetical protein